MLTNRIRQFHTFFTQFYIIIIIYFIAGIIYYNSEDLQSKDFVVNVNSSCDSVHIYLKYFESWNAYWTVSVNEQSYTGYIDAIIAANFTVSYSPSPFFGGFNTQEEFMVEWKCTNVIEWDVRDLRDCWANCGGKAGLCSWCGHQGSL